jgi:two-component system, sensor histidine kinase PdtaS
MYKKQIIVLCFTVCLSLHGMAQQPLPDSLQKAIDTAKTKKDLANACWEAGHFYYGFYNMDGYNKAAALYEKGRQAAVETGDSFLIAIAYLPLAQVYDAIGEDKLPKALEYYTIHQLAAIKENDTAVIIRTYMNIASVQGRLGQQEATKISLKKLTLLAEKYNQIKNLNKSYVFAAYTSSLLNDINLCRNYFNKINTQNDTITNGSLAYRKFYFLTQFYLLGKENKYDEAIAAGEDALKEVNNISDSSQIYNLLGTDAVNTGNYKKAAFYREGEMFLYRRMVNAKSFGDASNTLLQSELKLKEENATLLAQKAQTQKRQNTRLIAGLLIISAGLLYIFYLATQRRKQNTALTKQVAENKLLLQELHHRVKNNLQIVSSFMLLQQMKKNVDSDELIKQLQSKIQALALIHQQLHQQNNFATIELQPYFEQLVAETLATHTGANTEVKYSVTAGGTILNLDTLTALALITTELLLNSVKYVAAKQPCEITVTAEKKNDKILFTYADNGQGLPPELDFANVTSTGLRLVKRLAKQIKAAVTINNTAAGLSYLLEIPC